MDGGGREEDEECEYVVGGCNTNSGIAVTQTMT
jgi:hypothetical protein